MTIIAGKNVFLSFNPIKAKFFGSVNNVSGKVENKHTERVLLHLMYSKCSPILTHELEAVKLKKTS